MNRLIFLHIPKAGGTTFDQIIYQYYQREKIYDIRGVNREKWKHFENLSQSEKDYFDVIKGHIPFGMHKHWSGQQNIYYYTIIRDPYQRIKSHYYYAKNTRDHYLHEKINQSKISFKDYALSDLSMELDNAQTRIISNQRAAINQCNSEMLDLAIDNITKHFISVGIVEQFDDSILVLKEKMKWKRFPYYYTKNANNAKTIEDDAEIKSIIYQRNNLDEMLYNFAVELLKKELGLIQYLELKKLKIKFYNQLRSYKREIFH